MLSRGHSQGRFFCCSPFLPFCVPPSLFVPLSTSLSGKGQRDPGSSLCHRSSVPEVTLILHPKRLHTSSLAPCGKRKISADATCVGRLGNDQLVARLLQPTHQHLRAEIFKHACGSTLQTVHSLRRNALTLPV